MRLPLFVALFAAACSSEPAPAKPLPEVSMRFARAGGLYDAPFPSDDLRAADGHIAIDAFPNPNDIAIVRQAKALIARDARGFATSGGVFFALTGLFDRAKLPDLAGSVAPGSPVALMSVDPRAPDFMKPIPVRASFVEDAGPYGAPNLLSMLPLQGIPLRPRTTYAAIVRKDLGLAAPAEMTQLAARNKPDAMPRGAFDAYARALDALESNGIRAQDLAGIAVFTTDAPTATLETMRDAVLAAPIPEPSAPFARGEVFDDYCVYTSRIAMPDYQAGAPPFDKEGGGFAFDGQGKPILQRTEEANLVVTVPRAAMPQAGYPTAVFVRTGGGGDRPLVDRGTHAVAGGPATVPGSGPARQFARAGFAGVSVDGPHGGLRNVTRADEQFLMFNVFNGEALRDNVRESALELALLAHVLDGVAIDASDCAGAAASVKLDTSKLALMGHSMGATIAPLAAAIEPRYRAIVLDGAGASYIENIVFKLKPVAVRPAIELLLGYAGDRRALTENDPALTLLQWAEEPADPVVYTRSLVTEPPPGAPPRHVLMEQGIVDHYIMPNIANAMSLSLGLDLAGDALDAPAIASGGKGDDLVGQVALGDLLRWSGRRAIPLPASGNANGTTAIVVQHPEDGVEDGHEVTFQTDAPKHEYRCFLATFASGTPRVPRGGSLDAPCP
jgi:hypothetical protein